MKNKSCIASFLLLGLYISFSVVFNIILFEEIEKNS